MQVPTVIHIPHVDKSAETPAQLMNRLVVEYGVPKEKRMLLFTYLRLAASFSDYDQRLKCVQARLQSLSVLIYRYTAPIYSEGAGFQSFVLPLYTKSKNAIGIPVF